MNPFIPKPFTPFQWVPMAAASLVETRLKYVQRMLKGDKGVEVMVESTKEAYIQGVLARGDRRLGAVLLAAHSRGGSKNWKQSMKELGIDEEFYLYRQREVTEILPWQHLDMGFDQGYLAQEYLSGQQEQLTPGCFPTCVRCGICREDKDAK
jgi:hypothetical protein